MKPHVCPKCDGESLRMSGCAPCKGSGVVWHEQIMAPSPNVWPQPYIFIPTQPVPYTPYVPCDPTPQITWTFASGVTVGGTVTLTDMDGCTFTCAGTLQ